METIYQSLVAVNPVTLIAQICNLFIQLFIFKKCFWDKILAILDQRRQAADQEISDAKVAHAEADAIKAAYEQNMKQAQETYVVTMESALSNEIAYYWGNM